MSVLIAEDLHRSFGAQVVLEGVSILLQPGERVGLLGINGSGKSTLAKILAGEILPDSGEVRRAKNLRISYFAQEPNLDPQKSGREVVAEGLGPWKAAYERHESISAELTGASEEAMQALLAEQQECVGTIERLGGWERMHQVERCMEHMGVTRRDALCSELSGGEKRRVALARLLVSQPDLAILDEPTNHLDVETIRYLEEELVNNFKGALLFITHDRYMLDRVAQRIVEIDRNEIYSYKGGWDAYLEAKAERAAHDARTETNRQNFLRTELEWLSRSPQARTTKQKARIKRVEGVRDQGGPKTNQAASKLSIREARTGRTIIEIKGLGLELGGKTLIENLDLFLAKGDRVGVLGRNGAGKTSLFRAILGQLEPTKGSITLGETMRVGYFEQARANLNPEESIFENVIGNRGDVQVGNERITNYAYLGRFQFDRKRVRDKVKLLSGGERARVALAKMLIDPVNLLLLDEPTNDLDVVTLSSLEDMLVSTGATAIVITHDRYFLDRIATSILAFEGEGKVTRYASAYQALEAAKRRPKEEGKSSAAAKPPAAAKPAAKESAAKESAAKESAAKESAAKESAASPTAARPAKLTYAERIELEGILDRISDCETKVEGVEAELANAGSQAGADFAEIGRRLHAAQAELEAVVERWELLEAKQAGNSL
ncbi:MAG: ABC-F family ATP-binding cassette domain-containing protein [Myxococcales bacterium]|nr:ABC-F family ATP-binding cassette domain-containing protein [Myxococcales bacterium]